MNVRMHRARSGPSGVFKARSVAPSRGMRQSIITVLHIDTTVGHRAARRRTARVEPETAAKRERKRGRERERERVRERGGGGGERESIGGRHTLDRVQGCPLSAALRYPGHTRTRGRLMTSAPL